MALKKHDLTLPKQEMVKEDIIPDNQPPAEFIPEVAPHIDNSHMQCNLYHM